MVKQNYNEFRPSEYVKFFTADIFRINFTRNRYKEMIDQIWRKNPPYFYQEIDLLLIV